MARRKIAIIGGGVAGLAAAHVLGRTDEVTIFEADGRLGGHAHTHGVGGTAVDSGFIVYNEATYPLLTRLFRELGVTTQPSDMSMSVSCGGCGLEYAGGRGPVGLFAQPRLRGRGPYLRMLSEVPRFHRAARRSLDGGDERTLGEFARGHSPYFVSHFLTPLVSAVWSCAPSIAGRYPARYLFRFLANHGMLSVGGSPRWRTVTGGSRTYVERVGQSAEVHTGTPVSNLRRVPDGVELEAGGTQHFDAAVVGTHADQALRLLAEPTTDERTVLGAFGYSRNATVLHTDPAVLPRARGARASWNYRMASCSARHDSVRVSYDMNRLQRLEGPTRYLVTLGEEVADDQVIARMVYEHPVYTPEALEAQGRLASLNDSRIAFAGAYHGWGFHEDGCRSGVQAAEALGGRW
ncbi:FAD-dependent oxidoreductase [Actinomadura barringtoniae]|uniref:FAD-dependent oxidoreductase n=1 Tax=Actinomadura barringtoniae TaxID=1427535 RepID=A0A939PKN0_9ACTN|nr:FAD-dependent oxidoreductase [Actinomadura barringtoniae]MBO2450919.1 FAD-dependent oxidoreductase [Actinomadura barringtoniae]